MNHKHNESGFAAIDAVGLLVCLGIIGFIGWFIYHGSGGSNIYTSPDKKYAIHLADGWKMNQVTKEGELVANDNDLAEKPGTPATVEQHIDEFLPGFALEIQFGDDGGHADAPALQPLKTEQGNKIEVFKQSDAGDKQSGVAGETDYYYRIRSGSGVFSASYTFSGAETDRHTQVEAVLKTVQFK